MQSKEECLVLTLKKEGVETIFQQEERHTQEPQVGRYIACSKNECRETEGSAMKCIIISHTKSD